MDHANFHLDIKALSEAGKFDGLAAGYGNVDLHGDVFAPGVFTKSIAQRPPAMLLHHDIKRPAGRWDAFTETAAGLHVHGTLALDAADGREAYALLKAGALKGLSVGFIATKSEPSPNGRLIRDGHLVEISLVSAPSNPVTQISNVKGTPDVRELEEILRNAGLSGRKSKMLAASAIRAAAEAETPMLSEKAVRLINSSIQQLQSYGRQ
jgi:hypothetical protein